MFCWTSQAALSVCCRCSCWPTIAVSLVLFIQSISTFHSALLERSWELGSGISFEGDKMMYLFIVAVEGKREKMVMCVCMRESVCMCVCVCMRDSVHVCLRERECVCMRERVCVCMRERVCV